MRVIPFDDAACGRIRARLDAYLSDELSVETAAEVGRHLESCERCSAELADLERLRRRLREAVNAEAASAGLREAVTARLKRDSRRRAAPWLAIAAAVALTVGGGFAVSKRITGFYPPQLLAIELEARSLVRQVAAAYAPAIIDHVHCALYRSGAKAEVAPGKVAMELGEQAPVAEVVRQVAGPEATMFVAHKCHFGGREYVHMILMEGDALVSVVLTKKWAGEDLGAEPSATRAERFEIAGFEVGEYLAFVISDMPAGENLELARGLQGPLRGLLG